MNVRDDFPIFKQKINGKPLVYLDSTATSLKPRSVIDAVSDYYQNYSANVFRGIYPISEKATEAYEGSRQKVADFINANSADEVIFTKNTSESINLVAYSWVRLNLAGGDEIVTTIMEHHSNFVPWQQLAQQKKLKFKIWNINAQGELDLDDLDKLITRKTKLLAITAASNVLGTINPIKQIVKKVKKMNPSILVLVDAAQSAPHMAVDVRSLGADFAAFSSHKMLGPTGVGVLWGKLELLNSMNPFLYGGEMISEVHVDKTIFKSSPHRYEAGTPHIAGVIGLGAAVDYLSHLGMDKVRAHEIEITDYALSSLKKIPGLTIYGPHSAQKRGGVVAFTMKKAHPHDISQILADENICIRAGSHCAMPLHDYLGISATARASFYIYTTKKDVDALVTGLEKVTRIFR